MQAAALSLAVYMLPGREYMQLGIGVAACGVIIAAVLYYQFRTNAFSRRTNTTG